MGHGEGRSASSRDGQHRDVGLGDLATESGVDECPDLFEERLALGAARVSWIGLRAWRGSRRGRRRSVRHGRDQSGCTSVTVTSTTVDLHPAIGDTSERRYGALDGIAR